jgi:hypothetical protein
MRLDSKCVQVSDDGGLQALIDVCWKRAHAKEPAAARARLMGGRGERMVVVMRYAARSTHAVVDHVGVGEAVDGVLSVAGSENRRRRHKAKRRDGREKNREPEAETLRQRRQHWIFACSPPYR